MSLFPQINKDYKKMHCSRNIVELQFGIFCPKCRANSKNRVKRWIKIKQLYCHLVREHQYDKSQSPTLDYSIEWLQTLSDAVNRRWVR